MNWNARAMLRRASCLLPTGQVLGMAVRAAFRRGKVAARSRFSRGSTRVDVNQRAAARHGQA